MTSVNTNYGALVALQSLNNTTKELGHVQNRVNTGLKVASAADNGAVFAIAEGQRARVLSIAAVQDGIDRATSVINVGLSAGEAIGDILKQLKEKTVAAQASDLSQDQRDALNADFAALRNQINQIANAATFNGSNLVNGANLSGTGNAYNVVTSDQGGGTGGSNSAGQFMRTTALAGGTVDEDTDVTTTTVGGVASTQGFEAGDTISITFGSESTSYVFTFAGGETLGEVLDGINTATNGRLTAAFDSSTGEITYSASESFTIAIDDIDGTEDLDADVRNLFIATSGATAGDGSATSTAYVGGGGYQGNGTALGAPVSLLATLADASVANGDVLTIVLGGADNAVGSGGDDTTVQITLDGTQTIQDFLAEVSSASSGRITAHYNQDSGQLTWQSQEAFTVTTSGASVFLDAGGTVTGDEVPSSNSGASAGAAANSLAVAGFDFRLGVTGQALAGVTSALNISTVAGAEAATSAIDTALNALNRNLATLGAQAKALDVQKSFLGKLSDSIEAGIGNLVDADLAKESARLQALQVKQQLGAQALAIANSAPSIVLSFFR